jgi:hypothetical protein
MPLKVICFFTSLQSPRPGTPHADAQSFLLALKGEPISTPASIPVAGQVRSLSNSNRNDTIDWLGEIVADHFRQHRISPPFGLVPVPNPKATLSASSGPWTALLAYSIADHFTGEVEVMDLFRWKKEWSYSGPDAASWDGARLYENLAITQKVDWSEPVILVDYVFATGAPLQACAAMLRERGARVDLAICAGRTVTEASHNPFTVVGGQLRDLALETT